MRFSLDDLPHALPVYPDSMRYVVCVRQRVEFEGTLHDLIDYRARCAQEEIRAMAAMARQLTERRFRLIERARLAALGIWTRNDFEWAREEAARPDSLVFVR